MKSKEKIKTSVSHGNEKPLLNKQCLLEKYPGKGCLTFTRFPQLLKDKNAAFGFVKVRGTIDGCEIKKYHLMPIKGGGLFLPVKAEIRKKIKKEAGDHVQVILYPDTEPLEVPDEMLLCIADEPMALKFFQSLTESEQRYYINWIYSAKHEETKVNRLAKTVDRLMQGKKMYEVER